MSHAEKVLGNSLKRLNHPNLIPIFLGIALGCILGSLPFMFPGIPQPVKLGLAGGPLVVSILISRFGPQYKLITYTTMSANLMIREIGIALFLACVGWVQERDSSIPLSTKAAMCGLAMGPSSRSFRCW